MTLFRHLLTIFPARGNPLVASYAALVSHTEGPDLEIIENGFYPAARIKPEPGQVCSQVQSNIFFGVPGFEHGRYFLPKT